MNYLDFIDVPRNILTGNCCKYVLTIIHAILRSKVTTPLMPKKTNNLIFFVDHIQEECLEMSLV